MFGIFFVLIILIAHFASQSTRKPKPQRCMQAQASMQVYDARQELLDAYERQIANIEGDIESMAIQAEKAIDTKNAKRLDMLTAQMDKLDLQLAQIKVKKQKLLEQINRR